MKKTLSFLLFASIVFEGCTSQIQQNAPDASTSSSFSASQESLPITESSSSVPGYTYVDTKLGVVLHSEAFDVEKARTEGEKIIWDAEDELFGRQEISVYTLEQGQSIEDAILKLVADEGKDVTQCKVISNGPYWGDDRYTEYYIDRKNPEIAYTKEEQKLLQDAEKQGPSASYFDEPDYVKRSIAVKRLIEECSELANPLGLGTSKSLPSRFVFDGKKRFAFLPGSMDPTFYSGDHVIEFLE